MRSETRPFVPVFEKRRHLEERRSGRIGSGMYPTAAQPYTREIDCGTTPTPPSGDLFEQRLSRMQWCRVDGSHSHSLLPLWEWERRLVDVPPRLSTTPLPTAAPSPRVAVGHYSPAYMVGVHSPQMVMPRRNTYIAAAVKRLDEGTEQSNRALQCGQRGPRAQGKTIDEPLRENRQNDTRNKGHFHFESG